MHKCLRRLSGDIYTAGLSPHPKVVRLFSVGELSKAAFALHHVWSASSMQSNR